MTLCLVKQMHHYFLGNRLLASCQVLNSPSHSQAYFCPSCGEIWARLVSEDSHAHFDLYTVYCEHHTPQGVPGWGEVPGTLCQGSRTTLSTMRWIAAIEELPLVVLEREFRIMYEHWKKDIV